MGTFALGNVFLAVVVVVVSCRRGLAFTFFGSRGSLPSILGGLGVRVLAGARVFVTAIAETKPVKANMLLVVLLYRKGVPRHLLWFVRWMNLWTRSWSARRQRLKRAKPWI